MKSTMYDIMDPQQVPEQFIESFIEKKAEALRLLREWRIQYPKAYLVKVVRTRCPESQPQKGR